MSSAVMLKRTKLSKKLKREFREEETYLNVGVGDIIGGRVEETSDRIKLIVIFKIIKAEGKGTLVNI